MGNNKSRAGQIRLSREEIDYLKKNTHFDEETIKVQYEYNNHSNQSIKDGILDQYWGFL